MSKSVLDFIEKYKATHGSANNGNRVKTIKVPQGKSRWRLLPSWRTEGDTTQFFHPYGAHFIKKGENAKPAAVAGCNAATYGTECPICEAITQAGAVANSDTELEFLKRIKASKRVVFNALKITSEGAKVELSDTPEILELPASVLEDLFSIIGEAAAAEGDDTLNYLTDPARGTYILVDRQGTGINTRYTITAGMKPLKINAEVLKKLHDLDKWVEILNQEVSRAVIATRAIAGELGGSPVAVSSSKPQIAYAPNAETSSTASTLEISDDELSALMEEIA